MRLGKTSERRALVCAVSNIVHDQRVRRMGLMLENLGCRVNFYGRYFRLTGREDELNDSRFILVRHMFNREVWFYAEYNVRLFLRLLLGKKYTVVVSNDLDTLPACYLACKIRRMKLIFDSHELFTETPELGDNPFARSVWKWLEKKLVPRIKFGLTVSEAIAQEYKNRYGVHFYVLRNVPPRLDLTALPEPPVILPPDKKFLILQGTGINRQRGAEEALEALELLPDYFSLIIAGDGDVIEDLKKRAARETLQSRVVFTGRLSYNQLMALTVRCFAGLSLDKPTCLNYLYSLPNKIFDYMQARIPVIVSPMPEPSLVVKNYGVGLVLDEVTPENIAENVLLLEKKLQTERHLWLERLEKAARELCREEEEKKVIPKLHAFL